MPEGKGETMTRGVSARQTIPAHLFRGRPAVPGLSIDPVGARDGFIG